MTGKGDNPTTGPEPKSPTTATRAWIRAVLWLGALHRRMLAVYFAMIGPRSAYWGAGVLARLLYRLFTPLRARSEAQCRAALSNCIADEDVPRLAERSFIHRVWGLTDLMLAERLLHPNTYHLYGGRIPEPHLSDLSDAQQRRQPMILLTAYYGSFDLLPVFLGYSGIKVGIVYRPHVNADFDAHRRRVRSRGGCELIPIDRAADRLARILEAGGSVAIVADHHAQRRGLPVTFLGLPTMAMRSVGLLAWRYSADVAVACLRRVDNAFRFEVVVADILKHRDWDREDDPVAYITERYLRALEKIILADPSQYLWGYARWGEDFARRLVTRNESGRTRG